jgi:hypothetical protein
VKKRRRGTPQTKVLLQKVWQQKSDKFSKCPNKMNVTEIKNVCLAQIAFITWIFWEA